MWKYICLAIVLVCVESKKKKSVTEHISDDARIIKNWKLNGLHEVDLKKDEVETRSSSVSKLNYWPGGVVPYLISDTIAEGKQYIIRRAMDAIEEKSCVRFRPYKTGDVNYIYMNRERRGCWSYTGCKGGQQPMYLLERTCIRHGVMLNLLLHALGYLNRPDTAFNRDDYIKIHFENMDKGFHNQYEKKNITDYGLPYDYQSIMHDQPYSYSNNKKPTITPIKEGAEIGHNSKLSEIDVKTINLMYNCSKVKPCVTTKTKTTTSKLPDTKEIALWGSKIYVFL